MLEVERKYLRADFNKVRELLYKLGAESLGSHFESNLVFDSEDLSLYKKNELLRLRKQEWSDHDRAWLTYKQPAENKDYEASAKVKNEFETSIGNFEQMKAILTGLGYTIVGSYEKVREEWHISQKDKNGDLEICKIELDTVVFGQVIEIECSSENMSRLEKDLELDGLPTSTNSYFYLYREWLEGRKMPPSTHMLFPLEQKEELRFSLGLPN